MKNDEVVFAILAKDKEYCLDYYLECLHNQTYDKKKYIYTLEQTILQIILNIYCWIMLVNIKIFMLLYISIICQLILI